MMQNKLGWAIHNLVGHPAMEIAKLLGLPALADWCHDITLPGDQPKED